MLYSSTTNERNISVISPIKKAMEENAYRIVKEEMPFIYDAKVGSSWGEAHKWKEN